MLRNLTAGCLLICFVLSVSSFDSQAIEKSIYVNVAAGSLDRTDCVVSFPIPKPAKAQAYALRSDSGQRLPLQVDPDGTATFVLPSLKAGTTARLRLEEIRPNSADSSKTVQLLRDRDRL